MTIDNRQEVLVAEFLSLPPATCWSIASGRRDAARRISEDEGIVESNGVRQFAGLLVILVRLSGKADDDVGRDGNPGTRLAQPLNKAGGRFQMCIRAASL